MRPVFVSDEEPVQIHITSGRHPVRNIDDCWLNIELILQLAVDNIILRCDLF